MKKLSDVIESLGYDRREEQLSLIKLAAFTGCFNKKIKSGKSYTGNKIISNGEAEKICEQVIFDSLEEGIKWWIEVTQAAWFRRNQYLRTKEYAIKKDGLKDAKQELKNPKSEIPERPPADINRWKEIDEKEISRFIEELSVTDDPRGDSEESKKIIVAGDKKDDSSLYSLKQEEEEVRKDLKAIFENLYLIQPVDFKEIDKIKHVVIHGAKQNVVEECIKFFIDKNKKFTGCIYYTSNPRFLFNDEKSVAPIIAKWFRKKKIDTQKIRGHIQEVLDEENKKSEDIRRDWTKNLPELKDDILKKLKEKELILPDDKWPIDEGWYYRNPEAYNKNAEFEGLKYSPAGWPTAMDMVEYLLNVLYGKNKINKNRFTLCSAYPKYHGYKHIADTHDTVSAWYQEYGRHLPSKTQVVFLSTNIKLHYILYQDIISREILRREKSNLQMKTIGPGIDVQEDPNIGFCFKYGIDALAKTMYFSSQNLNSGLLLFSRKNPIKLNAKYESREQRLVSENVDREKECSRSSSPQNLA